MSYPPDVDSYEYLLYCTTIRDRLSEEQLSLHSKLLDVANLSDWEAFEALVVYR
jgi:hypothetical protein